MPNSPEGAPNTVEHTLTDFLLARITEDEAAVRKALDSPFYASKPRWGDVIEVMADEPDNSRTDFHLAIDPARVLAECEAKRRIVRSLTKAIEYDDSHRGGGPSTTAGAGRRVLNHLATIYADHPDYREEWRP